MWPVLHNVHFWFVRASARNALQLADSQLADSQPEANRQRRDEIPSINALSAAPQALTRSALVPLAVLRAWAPPSRREGGGGRRRLDLFVSSIVSGLAMGQRQAKPPGFGIPFLSDTQHKQTGKLAPDVKCPPAHQA